MYKLEYSYFILIIYNYIIKYLFNNSFQFNHVNLEKENLGE